jgi:hypothetical protein
LRFYAPSPATATAYASLFLFLSMRGRPPQAAKVG